jgi:pimeloyl-ACP methyl ester carboxylesterase
MRMEWIRSRFATLAWLTVAVIALHAIDDAWWHSRPETSVAHNLVLLLPVVLLAALWALLATHVRPALQAFLALAAGSLMVADAVSHVAHAQKSGVGSTDLTGFLVGLVGLALILAALALTLRPKAPRTTGRRWAARIGVVVGALATLLLITFPLYLAVYAAHKPAMDPDLSVLPPGHRELTLRTRDGIKLAASWVPPRNGAAVVLVHGAGGDRGGGIASRARLLARHGYGVLVYDARGSGRSGGRPENIGWTWPRDVRAALGYVAKQRRVTKGIGALGLSTGAEVVLTSAAQDKRIRAVVAEGAQARTTKELGLLPFGGVKLLTLQQYALALPLYRLMTHAPTASSIGGLIARIAPRPVLLISSGRGYEQQMNREYLKRAGRGTVLWEMPDAPHTGGLATHPAEYERRVIGVFDRALLGRS